MKVVEYYTNALHAALGALAAHSLVTSKESSKVVRQCSLEVDKLSVGLRKELIELDKTLVINND
jgi:hypothetical protein